jgi:hypothetical protein
MRVTAATIPTQRASRYAERPRLLPRQRHGVYSPALAIRTMRPRTTRLRSDRRSDAGQAPEEQIVSCCPGTDERNHDLPIRRDVAARISGCSAQGHNTSFMPSARPMVRRQVPPKTRLEADHRQGRK